MAWSGGGHCAVYASDGAEQYDEVCGRTVRGERPFTDNAAAVADCLMGRASPITHLHPCATPCTPNLFHPFAKDCPPHTPPLPSSAGTFVYRTSPEPLTRVLRSLTHPDQRAKAGAAPVVYVGRYAQRGSTVHTSLRYNDSRATELRARLTLRSTVRGANNRLAVDSFFSWDGVEGSSHSLLEEGEAGEGAGEGRRPFQRGLNPFVFVSYQQAHKSPLNLPVTQMDYFIPG